MASRARRQPTKEKVPEPQASSSEEETPVVEKAAAKTTAPRKTGRVFKLVQDSVVCEQGPNIADYDVGNLYTVEYTCPNPVAAAKKAFAKICRIFTPVTKKGDEKKIIDLVVYVLAVVEVSTGKTFPYRATRAKRSGEETDVSKIKDKKPFPAVYKTDLKACGSSTKATKVTHTPEVTTVEKVEETPEHVVPSKVVPKKNVPQTKKGVPVSSSTPSPAATQSEPSAPAEQSVDASAPQPKKAAARKPVVRKTKA